jgi:hypothetical protein
MHQVRPFDLFLAGALFFVGGAFFTAAMDGSGWQRPDIQFAVYAVVGVLCGSWQLRAIVRRFRPDSPNA